MRNKVCNFSSLFGGRMMRRWIARLAMLVVVPAFLSITLAACGNGSSESEKGTDEAPAAAEANYHRDACKKEKSVAASAKAPEC